jgi:dedicator of cytokinesis protein 3
LPSLCLEPLRTEPRSPSQYYLNDDFAVIEAEVIDRLDKLFMSQTKGDEISRAFFVSQLRSLFDESNIDDRLREQVDSFLTSVNSFLDLLLAVRNLPEGEEVRFERAFKSSIDFRLPGIVSQYQEDRIISTLKLMSFIRGIGRSEIFVRSSRVFGKTTTDFARRRFDTSID